MKRHQWLLITLLLAAWAMCMYRLTEIPPGPYHDEAYEGLDAMALIRGESFPRFYDAWEQYAQGVHATRPASLTRFPVFFEGNYGREPLYAYLIGLAFTFLGPSAWAMRLVSVIGGFLTIALIVPLSRTLFKDSSNADRIALAAASIAVASFWLLSFSRIALRYTWFLFTEGITILAFWQAWQTNHWRYWITAGVALGLGQYTYSATRFFPFVLGLFVMIVGAQPDSRLPGNGLARGFEFIAQPAGPPGTRSDSSHFVHRRYADHLGSPVAACSPVAHLLAAGHTLACLCRGHRPAFRMRKGNHHRSLLLTEIHIESTK